MAQQRTPRTGTVFLDPRGEDRSLRVTWHHESQLVVLSLWRDNVCAGTFRLAADEVPDLIALLRRGLDDAYDTARTRVERVDRAPEAG
ncbi:hypothetical protein KDN32_20470 [Nocardioides sp. J2M5]|uniref:hypothetical protein n=1 Tax=Nocardioides palaemonis TaxID=2829810 RepID=UPI001BA774B4|nr:hypothetical protein [Nocardioides palaemonis]MBS2940118.1 hypothetical protein [Nocardioides palaemonis]